MSFRYDINGLRALAVFGVVLFHFEPEVLPGGFSGVDVFFVISGFLMTRIIFTGLKSDSFNLLDFYIARVNRIVPALCFLCLALVIFGWFFLTPLDYKDFGKHVASSTTFLSNYIYWSESGYFDSSSYNKWLLHTWSLSVEWQFYLLFPIAMLILSKFFSLKYIKYLIFFATVFGFFLGYLVSLYFPNFSYYSLFTRGWEMMLGGIVYLFPISFSEKKSKVIQIIGLFLIISSYFFISSEILWPSYYTLIPTIGTVLVLLSCCQESKVFNNNLFQYIGNISYSLYLWHWPVVLLGINLGLDFWFLIGIPLSIFLGAVSYTLVEKRKLSFPSRTIELYKIFPLQLVVVVFFVGSTIFLFSGFPKRDNIERLSNYLINEKMYEKLPKEIKVVKQDECKLYYGNNTEFGSGCAKLERSSKNVKAVIVGDSHAGSLAPGVISSLRKFDDEGILLNTRASGCLPVEGVVHRPGAMFHGCGDYNSYLYKALSDPRWKGVPVIYIARFSLYPFGFIESGDVNSPFIFFNDAKIDSDYLSFFEKKLINGMCELAVDRDLYVVKPIPEYTFNVLNKYLSQEIFSRPFLPYSVSLDDYMSRNKFILNLLDKANKKCGVVILDPLPFLEGANGYTSSDNGVSLYEDASHLNTRGALMLSDMFDPIW